MSRGGTRGPKQPLVARANAPKPTEKRPRRAPEIGHNTDFIAWRTGWMDDGGTWGWSNVKKEKYREILQKLGHWEQKTWAQVLSEDPTSQHDVEVPKLTKDARDRLAAIKLEDYDTLFRFRLSGRERLWGIRQENIFYLLWWDPKHQVCPSTMRHT